MIDKALYLGNPPTPQKFQNKKKYFTVSKLELDNQEVSEIEYDNVLAFNYESHQHDTEISC